MATSLLRKGSKTAAGVAWIAIALAAVLTASGAAAQDGHPPSAPRQFDAAALRRLVGPIALYPDELIGIVLPASAYPLQIVQAVRFLDALRSDTSLTPDENWDDAVVALLNYPDVLKMMDADLDWTAALGEAFVYQQAEVLDAIQQFRLLAQKAGNLKSDPYQTVTDEAGTIAIAPVDPRVLFVPMYEAETALSYYTYPSLHYYPHGYPVYDYPYPVGYTFSTGAFWGVTTAYTLGWNDRCVYAYPYHDHRHRYHGYRYDDRRYVRHRYTEDPELRDAEHRWQPRSDWSSGPGRYGDPVYRQGEDVGLSRTGSSTGRIAPPVPVSPPRAITLTPATRGDNVTRQPATGAGEIGRAPSASPAATPINPQRPPTTIVAVPSRGSVKSPDAAPPPREPTEPREPADGVKGRYLNVQ